MKSVFHILMCGLFFSSCCETEHIYSVTCTNDSDFEISFTIIYINFLDTVTISPNSYNETFISEFSADIDSDFPDDLKIMAQVNYVDSVSSWRNVSDLITVNNSQEYCDQTFHGAYLKLNNDNI